jgi:hypothetical protein
MCLLVPVLTGNRHDSRCSHGVEGNGSCATSGAPPSDAKVQACRGVHVEAHACVGSRKTVRDVQAWRGGRRGVQMHMTLATADAPDFGDDDTNVPQTSVDTSGTASLRKIGWRSAALGRLWDELGRAA